MATAKQIELFTIGFDRPDLLCEQKRLLDKFLKDPHGLTLIDNSRNPERMIRVCEREGVGYMRSPSKEHLHNEALNFAALLVTQNNYPFFGFLDHDVFPRRETSLLEKIEKVGFYGLGQTHPPTGRQYLWPGFCFFSGEWVNGRKLDFNGIRGREKRDDGDTGSAMWQLFSDADWRDLYGMEHGYVALRKPDNFGLQSWGYELLGDWMHLTNASHWMNVPDPDERDRLALEYLSQL